MRILISNDDGVFAPGLRSLAKRLADEPDNEVFVVAPDRQRSATGHSLTLHKPLRVEEVELEGNMKRCWQTTGTPSDCVKLAVSVLLEEKPDIVISGINSGPNLGAEVLYSGTVAAAMEGAFLNVPSVAISLAAKTREKHYGVAADFLASFLKVYPKAHLGSRTLLNINVPNLPAEQIKEIRITELGVRLYDDRFEHRHDPSGRDYYWLAGQAIEEGESETSDAFAILHNMISITPVTFNMTDHDAIESLGKIQGIKELLATKDTNLEKSKG